jgi:hypothetical protein
MAGSDDWPVRARDTLSRISPQAANAHWLLSFVFDQPLLVEDDGSGSGSRSGSSAVRRTTERHEVEIGLRAFKDMPALALALERMGVRSPAAFAEVARAAHRLALAATGDDSGPIVRGWQAALAVLEQIQRHRPIEPERLARLLTSFAHAVPAKPMDPSGGSATWFLHELLPAFEAGGPPVDDMEAA